MWEVLSRCSGDELVAIWILGLGSLVMGLIAMTTIITQSVRRHYKQQMVTSLILEMLDRGMSAEDIVRILSAVGMQEEAGEAASTPQGFQKLLSRLRPKPVKTLSPTTQSK
jgi:pilus assembly protein TadC